MYLRVFLEQNKCIHYGLYASSTDRWQMHLTFITVLTFPDADILVFPCSQEMQFSGKPYYILQIEASDHVYSMDLKTDITKSNITSLTGTIFCFLWITLSDKSYIFYVKKNETANT